MQLALSVQILGQPEIAKLKLELVNGQVLRSHRPRSMRLALDKNVVEFDVPVHNVADLGKVTEPSHQIPHNVTRLFLAQIVSFAVFGVN